MIKHKYSVHLNTQTTGLLQAGELILLENNQRLEKVGFRYTPGYLSRPHAFALDPAQLPLRAEEFVLNCDNTAPALIDDYLPDDWGKKVLVKIALQNGQRLNSHCVSDVLRLLQNSPAQIGALRITEEATSAEYTLGIPIEKLQRAEEIAAKIDDEDVNGDSLQILRMLHLSHSGTGVGGARPKALVHDDHKAYLAKFNRRSDLFNNAHVELACLKMARAAGITIYDGKIFPMSGHREALLLERFDVQNNTRRHLITANGLLKDPYSQQDLGHSFRYDDLYNLICQYSADVEEDLKQLLRIMLFNRAINNTDDHERNFSFIHTANGYRLAPAYDLVPSLTFGAYHAAGFDYRPYPPTPSEAITYGSIFGLSKTITRTLAQEVQHAIQQWEDFALQAGVNVHDGARVKKVLTL